MGQSLGDVQAAAGEAAERSRAMTKGSRTGAWVLSARFLVWARNNGHELMIEEFAVARREYKASGADTGRYEKLSDDELTESQAKASARLSRLNAEAVRRGDVADEIGSGASIE